ncbi:hypothetical protein OUZ56_010667 [Daphnia magna]|uniref:Uncharacterized protein n=1 Tax=Daphnia magna TaxID=35525 RepID=A0ABR0AJ78_9CRUS|nr:hypothetical protein OUZ56_010667 [Daphnia magna]
MENGKLEKKGGGKEMTHEFELLLDWNDLPAIIMEYDTTFDMGNFSRNIIHSYLHFVLPQGAAFVVHPCRSRRISGSKRNSSAKRDEQLTNKNKIKIK